MKRMRALGRGLDALLGGDEADPAAHGELQVVSVHRLQPGKYQPRTRMDEDSLNSLADSIKTQGLMQPILVRECGPSSVSVDGSTRKSFV